MSTTTSPGSSSRVRQMPLVNVLLDRFGITMALVILMVILTILSPQYFLTQENLSNVARQTSVNALLALGQFLVILTAGIDLSVGALMALSMMLMALSTHGMYFWYADYYAQAGATNLPAPQSFLVLTVISGLAIAIGAGAGLLLGLVNGWGSTRLKLPHPFIMTLGMLNVARGATDLLSGGAPVTGLPAQMRLFGAGNVEVFQSGDGGWFSIPVALLVVIAAYLAVWFLVTHTQTGRHIYAVGGSPQASLYAGINVNRILNTVYMLSGATAALAALVLAGRTNSGFPKAGIGAELDSIAAVIIGGASFFGGRGTIIGTFVGVLIMGFIRNGLNLLNISVFWQEVAIGAIIVAAAYVDVLRRRAAKLS